MYSVLITEIQWQDSKGWQRSRGHPLSLDWVLLLLLVELPQEYWVLHCQSVTTCLFCGNVLVTVTRAFSQHRQVTTQSTTKCCQSSPTSSQQQLLAAGGRALVALLSLHAVWPGSCCWGCCELPIASACKPSLLCYEYDADCWISLFSF